MTFTPDAHTPYQWVDAPRTDTPLDSAHLEAAETDLVNYTQSQDAKVVNYFEGGSSTKVPVSSTSPGGTNTLPVLLADAYYDSSLFASKSAALQQALADLASQGGGCVKFRSGRTYSLDTAVLQIPPSVPIEIDLNGATVRCATTTAPRFTDWGRTADFQTFEPYIHGGTVDAGNINGANFGQATITSGGAQLGYTTVAAASNGQTLPQGTINVADTSSFPASGQLVIGAATAANIVTYTGKTATSFTGCTGGTAALSTGQGVEGVISITVNVTTAFTGPINWQAYDPTSGGTINITADQNSNVGVGTHTWVICNTATFSHTLTNGDALEGRCFMHVVCGCLTGVGQGTVRFNLNNPRVEDITTINVATDHRGPLMSTTSTPTGCIRYNIDLSVQNSQATVCTVQSPRVRRVKLNGGGYGVRICGMSEAGAFSSTTWMDDWIVDDVYHDTGQTPTKWTSEANVHISSYSNGGSGVVRNVTGKNSGDLGIEVDFGINFCAVEDCTIIDAARVAFGTYSYSTPTHKYTACTFSNCKARIENVSVDNVAVFGYGFQFTGGSSIIIKGGCSYYNKNAGDLCQNPSVVAGNTFGCIGLALRVPSGQGSQGVQYLHWEGFKVEVSGIAHKALTVNTILNFVRLEGTTLRRVIGKGLDIYVAGAKNAASTTQASWRPVYLGGGSSTGAPVSHDIEDISLDFNATGCNVGAADVVSVALLGQTTTMSYINGRIARVRMVNFSPAASGATWTGSNVQVLGTSASCTVTGLLVVEDCDQSGPEVPAAGNYTGITVDATNANNVLIRACTGANSAPLPAPVTITLSGNPATWTNNQSRKGRLVLSGGTISGNITYSRTNTLGGTVNVTYPATASEITMDPGDQVSIPNTALPTAVFVPER